MTKKASYLDKTKPHVFFCNGIDPKVSRKRKAHKIILEYRDGVSAGKNIRLELPRFVRSAVHYLPDRLLDLLEIATYVYCADRHARRGRKDDLEYHSWSREMEYHIKVRDHDFWTAQQTNQYLENLLNWITGDRSHKFTFYPGHKTPKTGLLDSEEYARDEYSGFKVTLFSGGLDSLSGAIDILEEGNAPVWLISHHSGNFGTVNTIKSLSEALASYYPNKVMHSFFRCHLIGNRAPEETQRTRAFLYCSMALALAVTSTQSDFHLFENGVTALNFGKRSGMVRARASRTAHPKTIRLLEEFFVWLRSEKVTITAPFQYKTKTDVVEILKKHQRLDLLDSSVSCSSLFNHQATHCGGCSQCIDRRFAVYAAECEAEEEADGIYEFDFISQDIVDGEVKTGINDFLRQARSFYTSTPQSFHNELISELVDAIDERKDEQDQFDSIYNLCKKHGNQVVKATQRMVNPFDMPSSGFLKLLGMSEFSRPPVVSLANQLCSELSEFIQRSFNSNRPNNENDLNSKIDGYLSGHKERFKKEHPNLSFATARTIPDHSNDNQDLLIETKYIRGKTTPSKVTSGIAEDLTKYPDEPLKLFLVYDPESSISDRKLFKSDFEDKRNCIIYII